MAKKGTYSSAFFNLFGQRLHGTPIRFGLLIGAKGDDSLGDVIFAAATPSQPSEESSDAAPSFKDVAGLLKSSQSGVVFADWAIQHAAAVRKLLPGGIEPLGCFAISSEAAAKDLAPLLAPILKGFEEPLVLTIDPTSRKLTFWQYAGGAKPALRPAQMKPDSYKEAVLLWCSTNIDLLLPRRYEKSEISDSFVAEVERMLDEHFREVSVSTAPLDTAAIPQVMDLSSESLLSADLPKGCQNLQVSFLRRGSTAGVNTTQLAAPLLRHRCLVISTALVLRRNVETRQALLTLSKELKSSALERLRVALEEAGGASGSESTLNLPWRALCRPEDIEVPLWCGDYCMQDEVAATARERLSQLLGLPESRLLEAPQHLDEWSLTLRRYPKTYGPYLKEEVAGGQNSSAKAFRALPVAACAAVAALIAAMVIPFILQ